MCKKLILVFLIQVSALHQNAFAEEVRNCTDTSSGFSCPKSCNEPADLPYTSTFCDAQSGACVCDCRDTPSSSCTRDPDMDCNILCENKNPNPEVFTYIGSLCPAGDTSGSPANVLVCVCSCSINEDYVETNDI